MLGKALLTFLIFSLNSLWASPQTQKRIQRNDSVTVSAGISKEQLALEDQLDSEILHGDELLQNGNAVDAIKQYESALDFVHKQPLDCGSVHWLGWPMRPTRQLRGTK